jgi:transposase
MLKTKITIKKTVLRQYARESPILLLRLKSQAVLMWTNGITDSAVADVVDRSERQVILWRRGWNKKRLASIFTGHQNNNAGKLTKAQLQEIKEVLAQPPSKYGIPKELWDVPSLKDYVSATLDIVYESDESYYFMLRFAGLSFNIQIPLTVNVTKSSLLKE